MAKLTNGVQKIATATNALTDLSVTQAITPVSATSVAQPYKNQHKISYSSGSEKRGCEFPHYGGTFFSVLHCGLHTACGRQASYGSPGCTTSFASGA
jgi:hypothetical protein